MQNLVSFDPRTETGLDELFRGFFKPVRVETAPTPVVIKMDVTETENGYLIHSEMPGVKKEDIDVAIEGNQVRELWNGLYTNHLASSFLFTQARRCAG